MGKLKRAAASFSELLLTFGRTAGLQVGSMMSYHHQGDGVAQGGIPMQDRSFPRWPPPASTGTQTPFIPPIEKGACLMGGAVLVFTSLVHLIMELPELWRDSFKYLIFFYTAIMGILVLAIYGNWMPSLRETLIKNCYFITTRSGRGHFFAFSGILLIALDERIWLPTVVAGLYLLSLACYSITVSIKARSAEQQDPGPYGQM